MGRACTSRAEGVITISSLSVPQQKRKIQANKGLISPPSPAQPKEMNKFLLICLAGAALVALSGAEVSSEEQSVAELSQLREVRAADSGKGKGKGKSLKKNGKKNNKGRNLKKSEKQADKKKKGDHKKTGRENGGKRSKKNGKRKKSRKNKANGAGKNKDKKNKKKARKAAKKADKREKKKARKGKKKEQKKAKKDRKNNNNNKRVNIERQSSCANETCIDNAVTYMKQLKLAVKNFGKQYNRILTNAKQSSGKSSKNNEFAPYLVKLRETGGGNASNMTCNGQKNQGAINLM